MGQALKMTDKSPVALITGADGFVGRYLAGELETAGLTPFGTDISARQKNADVFPDSRWATCDITNGADVGHIIRDIAPAVVFHLAGIAYVPWAEAHRKETLRINVEGTLNVLEAAAAREPPPHVIIISSSDADNAAYFLNSSHSFSAHLWSSFSGRTGETVNLSNGYDQAAVMMVDYQAAQLDVDGDGIANETDDLTQLAALEDGHLYAVRRGYSYRRADRPVIGSIAADQNISGTSTATLSVSGVYDADGISRVFAVIIPPDFVPDPDQTITNQLGTEELETDAGNPENYHLNYSGFNQHGTYIVTYYAEDAHGICSLPATSLVTRTDLTSTSPPDAYEDDDTAAAAEAAPRVILPNDLHSQFHTFHDVNDQDWAVFYAAAGKIYNVRVDNVSFNCDPRIEIFTESNTTTPIQTINAAGMGQGELGTWNCTADGIYYLRLTNLSGHWGANVWYNLRLYNPGAFSYDGYLSGVVTDGQTSQALVGAEIATDIGTAYSQPDGSYVMGLNAGSHTVTATKESYQPDSFEVTIATGNDQARDIQLAKPNSAPVISQGTSISVTMSEDGSPTPWSAPAVSATDADGDTLSWSLASGPAHGSASVSGTGASPTTLTYSPNGNFNGTDSFVIQVSDGQGGVDSITVNVTIEAVNDAPTAVITSPPVSVDENAAGTALSTSGSDVDGDELTYSWQVLSGSAVLHDSNTESPTFDPPDVGPAGGEVVFQLTVSDGELSATDQCTITVNWVPTVQAECTPAEVNERQPAGISVTGEPGATIDTITVSQTAGPAVNWNSDTLTFTAPNVNWMDGTVEMTFHISVDYNEGGAAAADCALTVNDIAEDFDHDEDIDGKDLAEFILRLENQTLPAGVDLSTFASELGR